MAPSATTTKKISHGRGGAGNIGAPTVQYVDGLVYSPPVLKASNTPHFTTGRGGAGNICKYDPKAVRAAQDVPKAPGRIPHFTEAGRGGVGNLQAAKKRESIRRQSVHIDTRTSNSGDSGSRSTVSAAAQSNASRASSISESGLADWAKNKIFGRKSVEV